jgi:hypothetical protein
LANSYRSYLADSISEAEMMAIKSTENDIDWLFKTAKSESLAYLCISFAELYVGAPQSIVHGLKNGDRLVWFSGNLLQNTYIRQVLMINMGNTALRELGKSVERKKRVSI